MSDPQLEKSIHTLAEWIRNGRHVVALTGAGISTPSGIPDFRSPQTGLWKRDNPLEVASWRAFRHHPHRFFEWLRPLAEKSWYAQPNAAHKALAELQKAGYLKAIITQNIDNLHQRAGATQVIELHGSLRTLSCLNCQRQYKAENFIEPFLTQGIPPRCPNCRAFLKPNIVLFEEMLPVEAWEEAQQHCENADLLLVIGSSLEVIPAAQLPIFTLEKGGKVAIITLSPTYLDHEATLVLHRDVLEVIPPIATLILGNSV
ncbi:NAD-dependent deacylase [Thermanaerothrix sp. 4228-RoL]|jgi:NAD-dependent deacetylase|uniref:protein acetyllysine N-acetyltransferase n=1 Tax=Thermanaerothrix solaris TaxID=3058434 RepID=A0ABU3NIQ9_9CHLR|nr:NAD-dependent deacylase [Thermanaerothrix sp. 4228-RoL]MDT8896743.1 NAD-dependent deacylase [Thermanaerothrix sp. 4228-RoL]